MLMERLFNWNTPLTSESGKDGVYDLAVEQQQQQQQQNSENSQSLYTVLKG